MEEHKEEVIKGKLGEYRAFSTLIESEFRKVLIRINSEENKEKVFLNFCDAIENTV